ncbi:DNA binding domain-containing protein, excisionase family [Sulfobacillus thermosulfidooxidans DSM 9293]|uniref:DNA binding domain-containing protein, excisionase family n=2 Tax=Sulfobacillus thermosulfidooxidans TaxID=28034 RepID=A0A1W1WR99_SULTA|nr:helix-turn-helix domain-containing protein [Sulfobacillus thermosulfidooxidans]PSR20979.1 MAG: helix-turn-helix domain-containing protein [Sulfobacillus thermosulfidooxidans]SMC08253.1 DNA binding domain-containing protein, excisionase family [Sulfobacillus thermosulfidooxidans DSM 9293]
MANTTKDYYTVTDVAELLAISPDTVRRLLANGQMPGVKISPRIWRIPVAAFQTWLTDRGNQEGKAL